MKIIKIIIGVALGLFILTDTSAQTENVSKEKMKALSALTGEWSGGGWLITREQERKDFTQKEWIKYELDGTIIQIKGQGRNPEGDLIHNAYAIMSYDQKEGKYFMDSYLEDGRQTKANMEIMEDGRIKWWFETPDGGTVRYFISIDEDTWTEKGEYSRDGNNWFPIIQFTLNKA